MVLGFVRRTRPQPAPRSARRGLEGPGRLVDSSWRAGWTTGSCWRTSLRAALLAALCGWWLLDDEALLGPFLIGLGPRAAYGSDHGASVGDAGARPGRARPSARDAHRARPVPPPRSRRGAGPRRFVHGIVGDLPSGLRHDRCFRSRCSPPCPLASEGREGAPFRATRRRAGRAAPCRSFCWGSWVLSMRRSALSCSASSPVPRTRAFSHSLFASAASPGSSFSPSRTPLMPAVAHLHSLGERERDACDDHPDGQGSVPRYPASRSCDRCARQTLCSGSSATSFEDGAGAVRILVAGELAKAFLGLSGLLLVMTGHEGDLTQRRRDRRRGQPLAGQSRSFLSCPWKGPQLRRRREWPR